MSRLKNKKRSKRLIEAARRRKHERLQTMTPIERRRYERGKERMKNRSYEDNYKLSFKENVFVALISIVVIAIFCGLIYLLYKGINLILGLNG
jgi:hypothetical protein